MKKIILGVVIFLFLAGVGVAGYFYFLKKKVPVEQILRADIMAYIHLDNPSKDLQKLLATPVWKKLTELDYNLLLKQEVLTPKQHYFANQIKSELPRLVSDPVFKKILGREITVGLYTPEQLNFDSPLAPGASYLTLPWLEEILSNVLMISRIEPEFQIAELLSGFSNQFFQYVETEKVEYKKYTIHLVGLRNTHLKLGLVRIKDLLVVGLGDKMAKRCIDVFEKSEPALTADMEFKKLSKNYLLPLSASFYFNIQQTAKVMEEFLREMGRGPSPKAQIDPKDFWKDMAGFTRMGGSIRWEKVSTFKTDLFFNVEEMDPSLRDSYASCKPLENKTVHFVPQEVLVYQWSNCVDLNYYWGEIEKEIKKKGSAPSELAGIEIKEILSAFGDEMGGYLTDIETGGLIPLPHFLLFAKINNQSQMEEILKKLFDQFGLVPQQEMHAKTLLHYLVLPIGESIQPGYCFLDQYLLLGINRQALKQSIDAFEGRSSSLAAQEELREDKDFLNGEKTGSLFVHIEKTLQKMEGVIQWLEDVASLEEKRTEAFRTGSVKRLEDVRSQLTQKKEQLKLLRSKLESLEKNIPANQKEIDQIQKETETLEKEIGAGREKEKELKEFVEGYEAYHKEYQQREALINEMVLPLLKSFQSFSSLKATTIQEKDKIESIFYLKLK